MDTKIYCLVTVLGNDQLLRIAVECDVEDFNDNDDGDRGMRYYIDYFMEGEARSFWQRKVMPAFEGGLVLNVELITGIVTAT